MSEWINGCRFEQRKSIPITITVNLREDEGKKRYEAGESRKGEMMPVMVGWFDRTTVMYEK